MGELGERQAVAPAVVVDVDPALFDVDVGRSVLAHRSQLHQVGVGRELVHGVEDVQRVDDVVVLREDGVLPVDQGVRRGRELAVMDDDLGFEVLEQSFRSCPTR